MRRPALRYTLLGDGSSDVALVPVLAWLLREHFPSSVAIERGQVADLGRLPERLQPELSDLRERMRVAVEFYACDVLFVHRDAEHRDGYESRRAEVESAASDAGLEVPIIPVVPVRMTEAWLLHDEAALRHAVGRPDGTMALPLPPRKRVESVHAKDRLFEAFRTAAALTGRRARRFSPPDARARLAALIEDFTPLRHFQSFRDLERDVAAFSRSWSTTVD